MQGAERSVERASDLAELSETIPNPHPHGCSFGDRTQRLGHFLAEIDKLWVKHRDDDDDDERIGLKEPKIKSEGEWEPQDVTRYRQDDPERFYTMYWSNSSRR